MSIKPILFDGDDGVGPTTPFCEPPKAYEAGHPKPEPKKSKLDWSSTYSTATAVGWNQKVQVIRGEYKTLLRLREFRILEAVGTSVTVRLVAPLTRSLANSLVVAGKSGEDIEINCSAVGVIKSCQVQKMTFSTKACEHIDVAFVIRGQLTQETPISSFYNKIEDGADVRDGVNSLQCEQIPMYDMVRIGSEFLPTRSICTTAFLPTALSLTLERDLYHPENGTKHYGEVTFQQHNESPTSILIAACKTRRNCNDIEPNQILLDIATFMEINSSDFWVDWKFKGSCFGTGKIESVCEFRLYRHPNASGDPAISETIQRTPKITRGVSEF